MFFKDTNKRLSYMGEGHQGVTNTIKAVAFDLDGTIYYGNKVADGAIELTDFFSRKGLNVFYFTNNSMKSRLQLKEKLVSMGLDVKIEHIYNSAHAASVYVVRSGFTRVYCVGADGLIDELRSQGVSLVEENVEAIIVGLDQAFDYRKLSRVLNIYCRNKCPIIACNRDRTYPVENNMLMPGCGPIISSIENACGKSADYVVGKPNTFMIELLAKNWNLMNSEILVVGDSYESDIEMGKRFNCPSVLISNNKRAAINDTRVVKDIGEIRYLFD